MSEFPGPPPLSPQFCFSPGILQDFLRSSRLAIDDTISQNLNGLATPARAGFDPKSTTVRVLAPSSRYISPGACQKFQEQVLFPAWKARSEVLNYCGLVAASPDPNDPEATLRDDEVRKGHERVIDERLDPYSSRFFPRETRTQILASLVRQERSIENIIRSRTWSVVRERCEASQFTWQDAVASSEAKR